MRIKRIVLFHNPLLLILALFLSSCANMLAPTGGPKDIQAPVIKKSVPENNSTNFKSKTIELTFDEYIILKDQDQQVIFSPETAAKIELKKKGKKLQIKINGELQSNTTYIINFGDAIIDYAESNSKRDYQYVFSTGETLDSLKISGTIKDAYKDLPEAEMLVALYTNTIDSNNIKSKPAYTVRSDKEGKFQFSNLKKAEYTILALKETNNNKIFDSNDELIGYKENSILLNSDTSLSPIYIFKEIPTEAKIKQKELKDQKLSIQFNKKIKNPIVKNLLKDNILTVKKINTDSLDIYFLEDIDSANIEILAENYTDTILIKKTKSKKKKEFQLLINNNQKALEPLIIKASDPFEIYKIDSIYLYSDTNKIDLSRNIKQINSNEISINYSFEKKIKYKLCLKDSSFLNYLKVPNIINITPLNILTEEDLGNLELTIKNKNFNTIIELVNESEKIIMRTTSNSTNIAFKNIPAGTYTLRFIDDENNNGIWDTGNFNKKIQPEKINYYPTPIKIRANWDLELSYL